jgi:peptidoglycan/LPS O-acetylase OafA/YrhL
MWTIPIEYQESMKLLLLIVMMSFVRRAIRIWVVLPWLFGFYFWYKEINTSLFITGYFLAELHASKYGVSTTTLPHSGQSSNCALPRTSRGQRSRSLLWSILVVVGIYFLCFPPRDGDQTFGYITLCKLFSTYTNFQKKMAVQCIGAIILCLALFHLPRAQQWLSKPLLQYLGRICFSLYLVHGVMIRTLGHRLVLYGWSFFETVAHTERVFIVVITYCFAVLPGTICVADLFLRVVEIPSIILVRWLERLVVIRE